MNPITSDVIDSLARRVRDPNNTAHPRDLVRDLLDRVQVLINGKEKFIAQTQLFTTTPGQAIYSIQATFGDLVEVTDVDHDECSLSHILNWRSLWKINPHWITDQQPTPEGWATLGRTLLVIYPAPSQEVTLKVTGVKRTTELVSESSIFDLESQDADLVKDAVQSILLWRQKDSDTASLFIRRLEERMVIQGIELTGRAGTGDR